MTPEQLAESIEQSLSVVPCHLVRQSQQELDFPDQVGQAELHGDAEVFHVLAVRREVVATQHAIEFLAQYFQQHIRASRGINLEQREEFGAFPLSLWPGSSAFSQSWCPGCPPIRRLPWPGGAGGLEEFDEFLRSRATSASSLAFRLRRVATSASSSLSRRSNRRMMAIS